MQELLGLSYEHFTQSVLLPQGGFSEFLRATPANRQRLLVELLAFGVYKDIGQRARERADEREERMRAGPAGPRPARRRDRGRRVGRGRPPGRV